MTLPKARKEELLSMDIDNELVIYDQRTLKIHSLNPTAMFVFQHCDGNTPVTELNTMLENEYGLSEEQAANLLWMSLDRLEKAHLLESSVTRPHDYKVLTRREVLQVIGLTAALLPVLTSIVSPTPAQASSSEVMCSSLQAAGWCKALSPTAGGCDSIKCPDDQTVYAKPCSNSFGISYCCQCQ